MMKGRCNCGRKATSVYLIKSERDKYVSGLKFCKYCEPRYKSENLIKIS